MPRMAKSKQAPVDQQRRDDWVQLEQIELLDGREAWKWRNIVTGEESTLLAGKHPLENPNSIAWPVSPPVQHQPGESDEQESNDDVDEESTADRVATLLGSLSGNEERAEVRITRIKSQGNEAYCAMLPADEFEKHGYDYIRQNWGAGKYRLILYATHPVNKRFVRRAGQIVELEPPPKDQSERVQENALESLFKRLDERLSKLEQPKTNAITEMTQMLALMKTMREALGVGDAPAHQPSPVSQLKEMMTFFDMAKRIREEIEPSPQPDDPLSASLPRLLDLVSAAMAQKQGVPPAPAPAPVPAPFPSISVPVQMAGAPVAETAPADQNPVGSQPVDETLMQLQLAVAILNARAARNADIEESAAQVYDLAPDDLFELLREPAWFEALTQLTPAIAPYRAWYERLRNRVLEIELEAESEEKNGGVSAP